MWDPLYVNTCTENTEKNQQKISTAVIQVHEDVMVKMDQLMCSLVQKSSMPTQVVNIYTSLNIHVTLVQQIIILDMQYLILK